MLPVGAIPEMDAPTLVPGLEGGGGVDPSAPAPLEPVLEVDPPVRGWDRVCFSCGHQGHGMSRCSWMDTSFPFLLAGWSVSVRNGHYRATWMSVDGRNYTLGKGGWSGREGQPPGSSEIVVRLTLEGESRYMGGHQPAWNPPVGASQDTQLDPKCPGLSGPGEPLFYECWTA